MMQPDLFSAPERLPMVQAEVSLYRSFLAADEAAQTYARLVDTLQWEQPTITVAGRQHKIPRLQAWYGDPEAVYTYSKRAFMPHAWTCDLDLIRGNIEMACAAKFNSVLANYYREGADGMGMHSDDEPELGPQPVIASLSLGAPRRFVFQPIPSRLCATAVHSADGQRGGQHQQRLVVHLQSGDLLIMAGNTQRYWRHGVPKTRVAVGGRINLTFRRILL